MRGDRTHFRPVLSLTPRIISSSGQDDQAARVLADGGDAALTPTGLDRAALIRVGGRVHDDLAASGSRCQKADVGYLDGSLLIAAVKRHLRLPRLVSRHSHERDAILGPFPLESHFTGD